MNHFDIAAIGAATYFAWGNIPRLDPFLAMLLRLFTCLIVIILLLGGDSGFAPFGRH